MRKNYYLLIFLILLFVSTISYAQMQGINASSERYARSLQTTGEFVKVKNIDNRSILTLCNTITGNSVFVKTKMGTNYIEVGFLNSSFQVYDFRILYDSIYFCGK